MKKLGFCLAMLLVLSACSSYRVPKAGPTIQLNLTANDVHFQEDLTGEDWALSIFPLNFITSTAQRAEMYAMGKTMEGAFKETRSDFVFQPRSEVTYFNLLLFDVATAKVVGKGFKVKIE